MHTFGTKLLRLFVVLVLLLAAMPLPAAQAAPHRLDPITGYVLWDTNQSPESDVIIQAGGHLDIRDATITMTCGTRIMVEQEGRLTVDNATLQGDGTAGCWGGIHILSRDNNSSITDSIIRDATSGIFARSSGPTITGNEITNLKAEDGDPHDPAYVDGRDTYGIQIGEVDENSIPIISGNYIHGLKGGAGGSGADGADPGEAGDNGGDGGSAIGIMIDFASRIVVENNTIENLQGGACANGGNGAAGDAGSGGGAGGDAGSPGQVAGIWLNYVSVSEITGNVIHDLYQPKGCDGGDGGAGGAGAAGTEGTSEIAAGDGSVGSSGGVGGRSSLYDYENESAAALMGIAILGPGDLDTPSLVSGNTIYNFSADSGGIGGAGGPGGAGGAGGEGYNNGGNGAEGGQGGNGGYAAGSSSSSGVLVRNTNALINGNIIHNISAGMGGTGGMGGQGGTGGAGGDGGVNEDDVPGDGGNGARGGAFGYAREGGRGGNAFGIFAYEPYSAEMGLFHVTIANNDVWETTGGMGGSSSSGTDGADGGAGGNGNNGGAGGNGGHGRFGGDGGYGSYNGDAFTIYIEETGASIINNTLVDPITPVDISDGGPGGAKGAGGAAGDPGGTPGVDGMDGSNGDAGNQGSSFGLLRFYGRTEIDIVNNIFANTIDHPNRVSILSYDEDSSGVRVANNNHFWYWFPEDHEPSPEEAIGNPNIALGPYTTGDPLFISETDHHLTKNSPCLDTGDNEHPDLPWVDLEGENRVEDGDGNGTSTVDPGAYEIKGSDRLYYFPIFLK